jgi:hypothetical protein
MTKLSTADSFIIRIYRIDTEAPHKLTGLVEALDGSGERTPFTDIDELAAALNRVVNSRRKNRRREKPKADVS